MEPPPKTLDGADLLEWAVSETGSVYVAGGETGRESIAAFAICRYRDDAKYYLFKCDATWRVVHDSDEASVDEAKQEASTHELICWQRFG